MSKYTILVVDDDPAILSMLGKLLTSNPDYRVLLAEDSKRAVQSFYTERRIDVLLTDIHMPGSTGLEMVSDMNAVEFEPEILVMTANGTPENVEKAREIGARSLILKPFDRLEVLEAEIHKAIAAVTAKRNEQPPRAPAVDLTGEPDEDAVIYIDLSKFGCEDEPPVEANDGAQFVISAAADAERGAAPGDSGAVRNAKTRSDISEEDPA
jgi:CheY-like chemotaxis protein